ncbi:unnamed protein product [Urochloa decumbens]|uniref:OTU domain-containing protein n=1 Tax=Urochloa decumbens TaxID=240449 RepID=A0ABC9H6N3_9POAL
MDSGSAKNQDNNQTKEPPGDDVPRPPEESKAAPAAAAAAPEPPPPAPPSERLQERTNGSPEAGGDRNPSAPAAVAAEAASAAQRDGTGIAAPSPRGSAAVGKPPLPPRAAPSRRDSASVKPPLPPIAASISWAGEPKPAGGKPPLPHRAVPASTLKSKGKKPMSHVEVVESGMAVRVKWREMREGRRGMAEEFNELLEESKKAMPEQGTATQQKKQAMPVTIWHKNYYKGSPWRKFLDRVGISDLNSRVMNPAVNYETIPIAGIPLHYGLLEMVAGQGLEFNANALNLQRVYSEFRPVLGDGECFYRSFIFNYLEQVLDRQDTHEERRILAAAEEVAMQHARLGWADEFSRSHKAFKNLINKVKGWKISRWHVPTSNSYRKRKLLQYFNSYHGRNDIYAFLRFVAAIWMCSHSEEFTPLIQPEIEEGGYTTLTDWCLVEVIQQKVMTDHIQITALLRALEVSLRVEYLLQGFGDDLHTVQGSQDHEVPRVILLYTNNNHYDIIYPDPNAAVSQGSDNVEIPPANSPSQDRGGSCTGEKPGEEQIAQVESSPTGENPNQHTEQGGS